MGGRLTTPPSSASSSSTTAHRNPGTGSSTNLSHPRTHPTSTNHHSQHSRHRSNSGHQNSHGIFAPNASNYNRHRTTSNIDPVSSAFNFNLLRYVGLEHESDDQSSDDDSPHARRRLQRILIALRDVPCPVCHKTIPSDSFDKHILQCLSKPRIDYNEDTLTENKGECVICLDDLLEGQNCSIACLCIYHKVVSTVGFVSIDPVQNIPAIESLYS